MDNYERMLELLDTKEGKELINCIMNDTVEHIGLLVVTRGGTKFTDEDISEIEYCQNGYRFLENVLKTHRDERK